MESTALVYASHDRCNFIHNDWIVQRALRGDRQILFLPFSQGWAGQDDRRRQEGSWNDFAWFFSYYASFGLHAFPFYWSQNLSREDIDLLWHSLGTVSVVILGGGEPSLGLNRYRALGEIHSGDPDRFSRELHQRQAGGLLTVGYSAGVDQLCSFLSEASVGGIEPHWGFGLCRNVIAWSHFVDGREEGLRTAARRYGHCLVFGLPNDSGLALSQGRTDRGRIWQLLQMVIDGSWDRPEDQHHIKTRQGALIQHFYPDGRHWAFRGGDALLRIQSDDASYSEAFLLLPDSPILDYWTRSPTDHEGIEEILAKR